MIRRPPRSTQSRSSAASDVYKRQIQCRAGLHRNVCFSQYIPLKVLARFKGHGIGNLPEDVLGLGGTGQENLIISVNTESSRYLEDPDIRCCTREGDITCYSNIGTPGVDARGEVQPTESSTAHVKIGGTSSWCSRGSISVCSFHIDSRCIQQARIYYSTCRTSSVDSVYYSRHFWTT